MVTKIKFRSIQLFLIVSLFCLFHSATMNAQVTMATDTNYMYNWDGGGATGTGSEPNNFGWDCSPSVTWSEANVFGIRLQDDISYTYNSSALTGRILFVRWDGVGDATTENIYSYPATLEACKTYVFSAKVAWHNNGGAPTYSYEINTEKDNSGTTLAIDEYTVPSKEVLHDIELVFSTKDAGTYYFTLGSNSAVLGAIRDLSLVEYSGDPFINVLEDELVYDSLSLSNTFTLSAYGLTEDITFSGPAGMLFTPTTVTPGEASCGIDVTAAFDNKSSLTSDTISITSGTVTTKLAFREILPPWMAEGTDTLSLDGTWCWFQDPRAVYYEGTKKQTYTGWINSKGKVQVASYNHESGEVIINTISPPDFMQVDDHNNPTFLVREDGRLLVSYSGHFYGPMRVIVSTNPEDITSFGAEANFGNNVTYANPYQIGDSTVMFYRDGVTWHPTMNVSLDGGITWGTPQEFITRDGNQQRPYAKYAQDSKGGMHITFTTGHPRQEANNHVYYIYYLNKKFYKADGTFVKNYNGTADALNIDAGEAEVVYNASLGKGWTWDIALDEQENPVILYAAFPDDLNHNYYYATWNGTSWVSNHIVNSGRWFPQTPDGGSEAEPNYSGGMVLDPENTSIVYLSKQVNGVFEIFKYTTTDKGETWATEAITENTPPDMINVRPVIPRGHKPGGFNVIWMRGTYITYANYLTAVMYYKPKSLNTDLDSITVGSIKLPSFNPDTTSYDFGVPEGETVIPDVEGYARALFSNVEVEQATAIPGIATITVTSDEGSTTKTYEVNLYYRQKSLNADLESITVDGEELASFHHDSNSYMYEVPREETDIPLVNAYSVDYFADVAVTQATSIPGKAIIVVTSEEGSTIKNYEVNLYYRPKSLNADLESITVDGEELASFHNDSTSYIYEVPREETVVPIVNGISVDNNADVAVTQATSIPGKAIIVVTSEEGSTIKTFEVSIETIKSNNTDLDSITVNGMEIPSFHPDTSSYDFEVPHGESIIPKVLGYANDTMAKVVVAQASSIPGMATIIVTSESGDSTKTYEINILEADESSVSSSSLNSKFLFPNPTSGRVTFDLSDYDYVQSISLIDLKGAIIYQNSDVKGQKTFSIKLNHLDPGMYLVRLEDFNKNILATTQLVKR